MNHRFRIGFECLDFVALVVLLRSSTWPSPHLHNSLTDVDSSFFRSSIRSLGNFFSLKAASSNQFELIYLIRVHVFATFSLIHLRNQSSIMEINLIGLIIERESNQHQSDSRTERD